MALTVFGMVANSPAYASEFKLGCMEIDGTFHRDPDHDLGFGYCIFAEAVEVGATDWVLCGNIPTRDDADRLLNMVNMAT